MVLCVAQSPRLISEAFLDMCLGEHVFNSLSYLSKIGGLEDFPKGVDCSVWRCIISHAHKSVGLCVCVCVCVWPTLMSVLIQPTSGWLTRVNFLRIVADSQGWTSWESRGVKVPAIWNSLTYLEPNLWVGMADICIFACNFVSFTLRLFFICFAFRILIFS
jgi:hypothetical protein